MKLDISRHLFEKYTSTKFHENPLNGSRVVAAGWLHRGTDGQTNGRTQGQGNGLTQRDRQTDMKLKSSFSQFCVRA